MQTTGRAHPPSASTVPPSAPGPAAGRWARGAPWVLWVLWALWLASRAVLLLLVFKVWVMPGPDVTSDVHVIYQNWYGVLGEGTFPQADVTWQYPPAAALAILSPAVLPWLGYAEAFFVLAFLVDLLVFALLLRAGRGSGRSPHGAWLWTAGVPLLGPTVYSRYDLMVTAVAVGALLALRRRPRLAGALVGFGAMLKVWPVLLLAGAVRRATWVWAAVTAAAVAAGFALAMPGAFAFLTFQRDRGTEVESLGALVLHVARQYGWEGQVLLNYGSMEFLGPHVETVSRAAMLLTAAAFGWLLFWRWRARPGAPGAAGARVVWGPAVPALAALVAVLMFTVTSRVISPQYMVWLVGVAAVCVSFRGSGAGPTGWVVVAACGVTLLEFPLYFGDVVGSTPLGLTLLFLRNGLLVAATLMAADRLWEITVSGSASSERPEPADAEASGRPSASS
ncbi:glycosyltransferase family 87 protein [Streptomyces abyssomicinicus]|uniref:glycosyltransferase family 87 protein n=1 Tax=Streptomyces abyssomicinicus TaxID=574929 RepID=UPI0012508E6B|nr:glycosyltransferase family 87 protein [Streptomyces abyssomicinicus]